MLTLVDIKTAINTLLKNKFKYKVYGREVRDGFDRPSFFVELLPTGMDYETQNFTSNRLTVIITYFQPISQEKGYSDLDNITMYASLKDLFGMKLAVGTRYLTINNFRAEYTGENLDILQVYFDLPFFDTTDRQRDTEPLMETIEVNMKEG